MSHMVRQWADWLANTVLSQWFQNELWIVPTSQSIHILALSVVLGCAVMLSLRLLGIGATSGRCVSRLVDSLVPWIYRALVVQLLTGAVQTIAEPLRQFGTLAFWLKMLMIPVVLSLTAAFAGAVRRNPAKWDSAATRPASAKVFALVSLALWVGIIWCGRFIGYSHV
jgi:type III secretory pathway component EscS